jgi:hypothetical protein
MRAFTTLLLAVTALVSLPGCEQQPDQELEAFAKEGRDVAATYGRALVSELQTAMANGGPVAGIAVCYEAAPAIANAVGTDRGLDVGRTSLRVRNPANAPDQWERVVLTRFDEAADAGRDAASLEHVELVEAGGRRALRYMKAIPTAPLCLTCHGTDIDADVLAIIDDYYPDDQARNFAVGDIRGAFTITKWLDD